MGKVSIIYRWPHIYNGRVIGEIKRVPKPGGGKVDIPCYKLDGDEWISEEGALASPYPLMGLDECSNLMAPVIVGEGQKVRQFLSGLGYQAVNSIFGSSSAHRADWSPLSLYKEVWIARDEDEPGEKFERAVFDELTMLDQVPRIRLLRLPKLSSGSDACDWGAAQPELEGWNELDPIHDHPSRELLRTRFEAAIKQHLISPPEEWQAAHEWGKPEDVDADLRKILPLPSDMLPAAIRDWCADVAYRMECPLEYTAVGALVAVGSVIGCGCAIKPKRHDSDFVVFPNLWGIVAGPPGTIKSPALAEMMKPLQQLDNAAHAAYETEMKAYKAKQADFESKLKKQKSALDKAGEQLERDAETDELQTLLEGEIPSPACRRYVVNDATVEAMCVILRDNPRGALLFQDELAGLLTSWDTEGKQRDRPFYLSSWNGGAPYTVDRKTQDKIRIPSLTVSILGCMQPDTIREYLVKSATNLNDGLMQRFQLAVYIDQDDMVKQPEIVDAAPKYYEKRRYAETIQRLAQDNFTEFGAITDTEGGKPHFTFTESAQELYFDWARTIRKRSAKVDDSFMQQHLSKYTKLMPALALIFHLLDVASSVIGAGPVTHHATMLACQWCDLLEMHARRMYAIANNTNKFGSVLAKKIQEGRLPNPFTNRDLQRKHWRGLRDEASVLKALNELVEANWLKQRKLTNSTGRPSIQYRINPLLGV